MMLKKSRVDNEDDDDSTKNASKRVSVIIPTHNVSSYIIETLEALKKQELSEGVELEISIHDDGSTDGTYERIIDYFENDWHVDAIHFVISRSETAGGPGRARNLAVKQSSGPFLCFNDADDISLPLRVQTQLNKWLALGRDQVLVGSRFIRDPPDATKHYAAFLNSLDERDLLLKSFRELTLIQPTWFMSRKLFDSLGGYHEVIGEDLELFHRLLDLPDTRLVTAAEEPLIIYRHLSGSVSSKTSRMELVRIKVAAFERRVLNKPEWQSFSVWGAGRDGRAFFEALGTNFRQNIREYVDVDENKIKSGFHHSGMILPVKHVSKVQKPFVVCVAMGRTGGALEANISTTGAIEGVDYWHFN